MANQVLTYLTCETLPCERNYPADVILCVTPSKLAANDVEVPTHEYKTLEAILTNVTKGCNGSPKKFEFTYNDTLIATGQTLYATDILGIICKGCLTDWILDEIARG